MRHLALAGAVLPPLLLGGCTPHTFRTDHAGPVFSQARAVPTPSSTVLALDVLALDAAGAPLPCGATELHLDVTVATDGGPAVPVAVPPLRLRCDEAARPQLALALDPGGADAEELETLREGAAALAARVTDRGGRASAVRISTVSSVVAPLDADAAALAAGLDTLAVDRGWTALHDGLRLANETLGVPAAGDPVVQAIDPESACDAHDRLGILAFTHGEDDNSAGQRLHAPGDDGIDTSWDDVRSLRVGAVRTPIHTLGLGRGASDRLGELSAATGGRHLAIADADDLPAAFDLVGDWLGETGRACVELPSLSCGLADVELRWRWTAQGREESGVDTLRVHVPCPATAPRGRSATVLLTLDDPGIPEDVARTLAANALRWADPRGSGEVLVVQDDDHHGEDVDDTARLERLLTDAGFQVTRWQEPADGLDADRLRDWDLVWFANPGWPMDDAASFDALRQHVGRGGGLVLQGDDMTWSMGRAFSTASLVHLDPEDNGTRACGRPTDDGLGEAYRVTLEHGTHPILQGLQGVEVRYGDDLDHSRPRGEGEEVLAWAQVDGAADCTLRTPALVAHEP
ncbi:MAG: hypothetical protein H6732_13715 [Alphaproteobacteria bacterium]|nr:hypothetical protein [Alphaproteobacteria bacterium]